MQRSKLTILSMFTVGLISFAIAGCATSSTETNDAGSNVLAEESEPETNTEENSTSNSSSQGEAIFKYGDTTYTSELQFCALTEGEDALFHGIAYDDSGNEVGYLDGDFGILDGDAFGEGRIDFGVTGQFESSDDFIALGDAASNIVMTDFSDTNWFIMGGAWDQDGTQTPSSTLQVSCG